MIASPGDRVHVDLFEQHRPRLFGVAYGMLGSVMDAEDIVQDAWLRWTAVDVGSVDSPAAYLTTVTTRLAIDRLRSARHRRETYVGPWLPDPLVSETDGDPGDVVAEAEQLSMAMLTALERLDPTERAVLLLREVFDLDYAEIADVVDTSPANCRQIAHRARDHVGDMARNRSHESEVEARLLEAYITAIAADDAEALAAVFADDVVLWSDGGGKARAARHPLAGAARVARFLVGVSAQTPPDATARFVRVNGEPALMGVVDGSPIGVLAFEIADERITAIRAVLNPDKLEHIECA